MPSEAIEQEKIVPIGRHLAPSFCAMIVERDSMSSGLLADAIARELRCDAVAIRPANLLPALGARRVELIVISMDLHPRSASGFDLVKAVSCDYPLIPIIVLAEEPTPKMVIDAFRSGARGLFSRQEPMSEFIDCVEHVRKGRIWAGGEESNYLLNALKSMPAPNPLTEGKSPSLTTRELQVVRQAATGKTNKTIASELGLSEHTVKNYLFRAFDKLGVSSRVELLFYLTTSGHSLGPSKTVQEKVDVAK